LFLKKIFKKFWKTPQLRLYPPRRRTRSRKKGTLVIFSATPLGDKNWLVRRIKRMKLVIALLSVSALCDCGATKSSTTTPQPQPISIVEPYAITVGNSPMPPTGWAFQPQTVTTRTIPVATCLTDFSNLMSPNTMPLPLPSADPNIFTACAFQTGIPLPAGQSNWLQTIVFGTTSEELYSGEPVYYVLLYSSADGSTGAVLGGQGTFTATTTVQGTTTTFNYQISGPINCLTINNSVTAACTAWQTTFTANVS
jgi:hypothetical protein